MPSRSMRPRQQALSFEPSEEQLREELERMRLSSAHWRRRFKTLEQLLSDPQAAPVCTACARHALRARGLRPR